MSGAEAAVRARTLALLQADAELAGLVHGIFDGVPARATAPFVALDAAEGRDWGTKDRAGREVRLTLAVHGAGAVDGAAAARIEAIAATLRGGADGWAVVGARVERTRTRFGRDGGWRHEMVLRCRCLVGDG